MGVDDRFLAPGVDGWWLVVDFVGGRSEALIGKGEVVWARCPDIAYGRIIYNTLIHAGQ